MGKKQNPISGSVRDMLFLIEGAELHTYLNSGFAETNVESNSFS